jgi:hypothetical protein
MAGFRENIAIIDDMVTSSVTSDHSACKGMLSKLGREQTRLMEEIVAKRFSVTHETMLQIQTQYIVGGIQYQNQDDMGFGLCKGSVNQRRCVEAAASCVSPQEEDKATAWERSNANGESAAMDPKDQVDAISEPKSVDRSGERGMPKKKANTSISFHGNTLEAVESIPGEHLGNTKISRKCKDGKCRSARLTALEKERNGDSDPCARIKCGTMLDARQMIEGGHIVRRMQEKIHSAASQESIEDGVVDKGAHTARLWMSAILGDMEKADVSVEELCKYCDDAVALCDEEVGSHNNQRTKTDVKHTAEGRDTMFAGLYGMKLYVEQRVNRATMETYMDVGMLVNILGLLVGWNDDDWGLFFGNATHKWLLCSYEHYAQFKHSPRCGIHRMNEIFVQSKLDELLWTYGNAKAKRKIGRLANPDELEEMYERCIDAIWEDVKRFNTAEKESRIVCNTCATIWPMVDIILIVMDTLYSWLNQQMCRLRKREIKSIPLIGHRNVVRKMRNTKRSGSNVSCHGNEVLSMEGLEAALCAMEIHVEELKGCLSTHFA